MLAHIAVGIIGYIAGIVSYLLVARRNQKKAALLGKVVNTVVNRLN